MKIPIIIIFILCWCCCSAPLHLHSALVMLSPRHPMEWAGINDSILPSWASRRENRQKQSLKSQKSCGCENPPQSSGPEPGISKAGLGTIIFPGNTVKIRSGVSSHIYIFSLFHGTKIGLKFNLLLLLWHQHFTRLLKNPWNLYLTWKQLCDLLSRNILSHDLRK